MEKSELRSAETFRQCDVPASVNMTNAERPSSGFGGYLSTKSLLQNQKSRNNF